MGGNKKKTIAQADKQQQLQNQKQEKTDKKKPSKEKSFEKKIGGIAMPNIGEKELTSELSKMKAITPYTIATKYNLKISIAKNLLDSLEKIGKIQLVAGRSSIKIYKFGSLT